MSIDPINTAQILGGAEILGHQVKSDRDLEQVVYHGLPVATVKYVAGQIYAEGEKKYYELVPRTTLERRKKSGSLNHEESQKVERLARVFSFAIEVWGDKNKAREFMQKSHPMLDNRTPFEASLSELGARQVENVLGRLMFGISA